MLMTGDGFQWLEEELLEFFEQLTKAMPSLNGLTIDITKYKSLGGKVRVHGFHHTASNCTMFDNLNELFDVYKRRQILFHHFEAWEDRAKEEQREAIINAID